MPNLRTTLLDLGLPTHSADIYVRLVQAGESKAADLIKASGTHRQLVYQALKDLEARRLATSVKRNSVMYFQALSIDPLIEDLRRKEYLASAAQEEINRLKTAPTTNIIVYQGTQGINDFMEKVLEVGETVHLIGAHFRFKDIYPELWFPWQEMRAKREIKLKAVIPRAVPPDAFKGLRQFDYRLTDADVLPNVVWIFGDHVANIVWIDREQTVAFTLRHAHVAKQHRQYFDHFWKTGTKK